jgi:protein involved in polysaccharide export with SLBB domain
VRLGRAPLFGLLLVLFCCLAPTLHAQAAEQLPSAEEARILLMTRPDLLPQIREQLAETGLSEDELRDRMSAAGYPEDLIDQVLQGFEAGSGESRGGLGGRDSGSARGALGTAGRAEAGETDDFDRTVDALSFLQYSDPYVRDSIRADSLGQPWTRPLQVFGLDVFRRASSQFQPARSGPVPDTYRLGPGDRLSLVLTGDVQRAYNLEVSRDGQITIPEAGQLFVANISVADLERQLAARLSRFYSGLGTGPNARTRMSVTVTRIRTVQVFVTGDVARPGAYQISATGDALAALFAAGGPTARGTFREIELRRGGGEAARIDLYDYLTSGSGDTAAATTSLQNGDRIFVPVQRGRVKITGRVVRPAIYELTERETLRDLLSYAGGFEAEALRQRVQIHRILPPEPGRDVGRSRVVVDVGPEQFQGGGAPGVAMLPGDSVVVFEVPERVRSYVRVEGDVWVPGVVGFREGLRLSDAIRLAGGPKPDVYLDQILVSRLQPDSTRIQLRSAFADTSGRVTEDLVLQEEDEIQVFSRTTFRPERYVVVTGAVRSPGRIRYREGMTARDAILLSGGLTEDAYLKEAELARVPEDRSRGEVSRTVRVPLDSTYLFGRNERGAYPGPPGVPAPASGSPEVRLQPYDNLLILRQPEWELPRTVKIAGQVRYPGPYALRTKTERLADLIERAGGLTREAYAGGVEFYRAQDSTGRVGIELAKVLKNPRHRDNFILAAGDSIFIPEFQPTIAVRGAVNAPGAVAYEPGRSLDWYVRAAGGFADTGDRDHAYVVQPNGEKETVQRRFLLADGQPRPRPGATVIVPERRVPRAPSSLPTILGIAAQLLAGLATLIVVVRQ